MTPQEARRYLVDNSRDGGIYNTRYMFVFNGEDYEKAVTALEIADGSRGVWANNLNSFNTSGVTLFGPVSGLVEDYVVIGVTVRGHLLFNPGYIQEVMNTATHELVHAAQFAIKAQSRHDLLELLEPIAYLVGWLMEKWLYALYKKYNNVIIMAPGPRVDNGLVYTALLNNMYRHNNQRLMDAASKLSPKQIHDALVREVINNLNTTVVVESESWSSTTFFQGSHK